MPFHCASRRQHINAHFLPQQHQSGIDRRDAFPRSINTKFKSNTRYPMQQFCREDDGSEMFK